MGVPVLWAPHSLHLGCVGHMADFPLGGGRCSPFCLIFGLPGLEITWEVGMVWEVAMGVMTPVDPPPILAA